MTHKEDKQPDTGEKSWPRPPLWGWPVIFVRLAMLLATLLPCIAAYYLLRPVTRHNPAPRFFLRAMALIVGLRLSSRGARPRHHETRILLANHVTWMDIPALAGASGCAFVAHDGLASVGPLRWLCEMNDTVFIARHDRRSVARQVQQVRTALAEAGSLALFPEGTTGDGTDLLPFKSSLLSAIDGDLDSIPVQPVWIDYGAKPEAIAWVGEEPGLAHVLRMLARLRPIRVTIHFLEPLTSEQRRDRKTIAQAACAAIGSALHQAGLRSPRATDPPT